MQHHNVGPSPRTSPRRHPSRTGTQHNAGVLLLKVVPRVATFIVSVLIYVTQSGCRNVTMASRVAGRILIIGIPQLLYGKHIRPVKREQLARNSQFENQIYKRKVLCFSNLLR